MKSLIRFLSTGDVSNIYQAVSYWPEESLMYVTLIREQLPRPRTTRRLWDISLKLSGGSIERVVPSHAARMLLVSMGMLFVSPVECTRRGCGQRATARCPHCKAGYCGRDCQRLYVSCHFQFSCMREIDPSFYFSDWKEHKMVCRVEMEITPAIRDEAYKLVAGADALARVRAKLHLD